MKMSKTKLKRPVMLLFRINKCQPQNTTARDASGKSSQPISRAGAGQESRGLIIKSNRQMNWPNKNPFNKKWFQINHAVRLTAQRRDRLSDMYKKWEPRLWERGINYPLALILELRRIERLIESGAVDWSPFPAWVRRGRDSA